jgi:HPt (histidine-containing phosphotransfer) domain-containing protein
VSSGVSAAEALPERPPLDLAKLMEITEGDSDFTNELLGTFLASAEQSLDEMNQTLVSDDRQQLARAAHKLKGAASNVHACEVARMAAQVEAEAVGAVKESLATLIAQLRAGVSDVAEFVQRTDPASFRAA